MKERITHKRTEFSNYIKRNERQQNKDKDGRVIQIKFETEIVKRQQDRRT